MPLELPLREMWFGQSQRPMQLKPGGDVLEQLVDTPHTDYGQHLGPRGRRRVGHVRVDNITH